MSSVRIRELLMLFLGDLIFLVLALWVTLAVRYFEIPSRPLLESHLIPFSLLFVVWLLLFFMAGLYDQHTMIFRAKLPERILRAQVLNIIIAGLFFFFVPIFEIAPKRNLLIYLVVSLVLIVYWRLELFPHFLSRKREDSLLIGGGSELKELMEEVNNNDRYPFIFKESISVDHMDGGALSNKVFALLRDEKISMVAVDLKHRKLANILPHLYKPLFSNTKFVDLRDLYAEIFERLPLSMLTDAESIQHSANGTPHFVYASFKRMMDISGGLIMGFIAMILVPAVWLAQRFEGDGPLFIAQQRLGMNGTKMTSYKFRTMRLNDPSSASWVHEGENTVTRVGSFLRRTSLDEFPQFINILKGEMSLIGPRNDIEGLGKRLSEAIPFYDFRYIVKPGLTGWAQINQKYEQGNISPQSIEETKVRLAYDFYYIKNRSIMLDIIIALKTVKRMVFRVSSW
ncbi:MAG: hypothetical protein G01um10148_216 [Parcubacteria group bacterium Gr01-1014_8]|nr:MAG: hypothetical protein G01um10148_216 [Parcubacteria group bacterium Gr01-1014_8]